MKENPWGETEGEIRVRLSREEQECLTVFSLCPCLLLEQSWAHPVTDLSCWSHLINKRGFRAGRVPARYVTVPKQETVPSD